MKQPMLGGDGWSSPDLFKIAKTAINGHYFSNHYTTESKDQKTIEFVNAFKKKYNETPDVMAALAYDSAYMMAEAIKNVKEITSDNIRNELAKIKDFHGVTGKMSMNENRDAVKSAVVVQVQGEDSKFITEVSP